MSLLSKVSKIYFTKCVLFLSPLFRGLKSEFETDFGDIWEEDDDFVHIYKPEEDGKFTVPSSDWETDRLSGATTLWIIVCVAVLIGGIFLCCCLFFIISQKHSPIRRSSTSALVSPPSSRTVQGESAGGNIRSTAENVHELQAYGQGVSNLAFELRVQDRIQENGDVPPDYAAVLRPTAYDSRPRYHNVLNQKKVETPPPAYITVTPFQWP